MWEGQLKANQACKLEKNKRILSSFEISTSYAVNLGGKLCVADERRTDSGQNLFIFTFLCCIIVKMLDKHQEEPTSFVCS